MQLPPSFEQQQESRPSGIAIVGMACTYPGARDAQQFWQNIVGKVDCVTDVSKDRWDPDVFFDPDPAAEDKIYCKKGGWIGGTFAFNPLQYGIPPSTVPGAEPDHFLVLRAVGEAMKDAGYLDKELDKLRISVVLGKGNYLGPGVTALMYRGIVTEQTMAIIQGLHPEFSPEQMDEIKGKLRHKLPPMNAEVAAGLIPNICTGRVANRLDFMGRNFTVDAACASSLIATEIAIQDLESGKENIVLAGGVHIFAHIPFLQVFDAMRALSMTSTIRPYDEGSDGTIVGEGVGILVLKRLADAERDGDRIYAVIRGAGSSSDGRAKGVTAPRREGEELALRRAYESSGITPDSVGLIEGHGTATPVGDAVEVEALSNVFGSSATGRPHCALGSVKSMIGHAMPAAGAAGLIKAALSLYHRVLPPTLHCEHPRAALLAEDSSLYVNTETRPWIHSRTAPPRRAGVNAFGFGGVNAHILLEEYTSATESEQPTLQARWGSELVVVEAHDRSRLAKAALELAAYCEASGGVELRDIAFSLNTNRRGDSERLSVVATSAEDLALKLKQAAGLLQEPDCRQIKDRQGIYYFDSSLRGGKVAFLFPGEGSQYLNMLSELCLHFPEVRQAFDLLDSAVQDGNRWPASAVIFPRPQLSPAELQAAEARLFTIDRATEAVLTADAAILNLLSSLQLEPDMMVGHSAGEWIAMAAAGVFIESEFFSSFDRLSQMYARIESDTSVPRMSMLAVGAGREKTEALLAEIGCDVHVANDNCPHQVVAVVPPDKEAAALEHLLKRGVVVERLPYDRGYHTPAFDYICEPLRNYFSSMQIRAPRLPLYSCTTAKTYPSDTGEILDLASETFARPLAFRQTIEAMYDAGCRVFVEVGPRGGLTAFVDDTLRGRPHLSVPMDQQRRPGILALNHALAMLEAQHVALNLESLYSRRQPRRLSFDAIADRVADPDAAPGTIHISTCYPRLQPPDPLPALPRVTERAPEPIVEQTFAAVANGHPQANGSSVMHGEASQTMQSHFSLMEEFLGTQEAVMRQFLALGGASESVESAPAMEFAAVSTAPPSIQTQAIQTQAIEAQVIHAPVTRALAIQTAVAVVEAIAQVPQTRDLEFLLLQIVSERTGYPPEMLGLDLDMEADLGIDSIKRIEVLGAIKEAASGDGPGDEAMEAIAKLKTLRQVLAMLSPPEAAQPKLAGTKQSRRAFTYSAEVVSERPGQEIQLRCSIDPQEHLYLADHCLYFAGSEYDRQGAAVLSMPLTGSMEIMAEAAARLSPEQKITGFKNMQAGRWMNVDRSGPPVVLAITATRRDAGTIRVTIRSGETQPGDLLAECTVTMADRYPQPEAAAPLVLKNSRTPNSTGRGLYDSHRMFHGPSFQGVVDLDRIAEDGVSGTLEVLPAGQLFRSNPAPRMEIDPFLLDAAGQMVGYWPVEFLPEGFVALPIRVGELILYRENLPPGSRAKCHVRIRGLNSRQLKADIDIVGPDGNLWMRVVGWEDWRFYWQRHIYEFWRFPKLGQNGVPVHFPEPMDEAIECRRLEPLTESDKTGLWESLWMRMVLSADEIDSRESLPSAELKSSWLTERAIAKDALRAYFRRHCSLDTYPPDVAIVMDDQGRTRGSVPGLEAQPFVSFCAIGQVGFAAAGPRPLSVAMVPFDEDLETSEAECRARAASGLPGDKTVVSAAEGGFIFSIAFEQTK